jgi:hypothetical protein
MALVKVPPHARAAAAARGHRFAAYPRCSTDLTGARCGMTDATDDSIDGIDVPQGLVVQLNDLGFALVEGGDRVYTFARQAIGSEVHVTVELTGRHCWRVGVKWRQSVEQGRLPNPLLPMSLGRLGESVDGVTIHLSTRDLLDDLARLMAESVLPLVDLAPS